MSVADGWKGSVIIFLMRGSAEGSELVGVTARYLRECFREESPPRVKELAARLGMSPLQLHRAFQQTTGMSPARYFKSRQIVFAQRLLQETELTTNEVAYRAGFGTRATFFRLFRELVGVTPRRFAADWRKTRI